MGKEQFLSFYLSACAFSNLVGHVYYTFARTSIFSHGAVSLFKIQLISRRRVISHETVRCSESSGKLFPL